MYYYGGYNNTNNSCGCNSTPLYSYPMYGYSNYGNGAATVLVLFILLVIILGSRTIINN